MCQGRLPMCQGKAQPGHRSVYVTFDAGAVQALRAHAPVTWLISQQHCQACLSVHDRLRYPAVVAAICIIVCVSLIILINCGILTQL